MPKETITIDGKTYRVEVNWNALSAFLVSVGRDTLEGLSNLAQMKPSDISALMAAAINEGERLEGRECGLTAIDLGAVMRPADVSAFMDIYLRQSRAQVEVDPKRGKKKNQTGE